MSPRAHDAAVVAAQAEQDEVLARWHKTVSRMLTDIVKIAVKPYHAGGGYNKTVVATLGLQVNSKGELRIVSIKSVEEIS